MRPWNALKKFEFFYFNHRLRQSRRRKKNCALVLYRIPTWCGYIYICIFRWLYIRRTYVSFFNYIHTYTYLAAVNSTYDIHYNITHKFYDVNINTFYTFRVHGEGVHYSNYIYMYRNRSTRGMNHRQGHTRCPRESIFLPIFFSLMWISYYIMYLLPQCLRAVLCTIGGAAKKKNTNADRNATDIIMERYMGRIPARTRCSWYDSRNISRHNTYIIRYLYSCTHLRFTNSKRKLKRLYRNGNLVLTSSVS